MFILELNISLSGRSIHYLLQNLFSHIDPVGIDTCDCLYKVRCFLVMLKRNGLTYYKPSKYVAVDERMVKNKGRFTSKQYVWMKPVKWGFKLRAE